mmetsp:Transcript_10478/g.14043  ORF Transcript_10478/g.14043 Transcript_10478/m.14043 type:complete len:154 (-) Transcript_10478:137-598(-)
MPPSPNQPNSNIISHLFQKDSPHLKHILLHPSLFVSALFQRGSEEDFLVMRGWLKSSTDLASHSNFKSSCVVLLEKLENQTQPLSQQQQQQQQLLHEFTTRMEKKIPILYEANLRSHLASLLAEQSPYHPSSWAFPGATHCIPQIQQFLRSNV